MINLARRPERRSRMSAILDELGYSYTIFNAVDGRYNITSKKVQETSSDTGISDTVCMWHYCTA